MVRELLSDQERAQEMGRKGHDYVVNCCSKIIEERKLLMLYGALFEGGKDMVRYIGRINRKQVNQLYGSARAGIVIYQPAENHMESQPIKLFEFMAAGLPVVASNFPLWRKIVEDNGCGICVNPRITSEVKAACKKLLNNPELAQRMGQNGRIVVENRFSWSSEEKKLYSLYEMIIADSIRA